MSPALIEAVTSRPHIEAERSGYPPDFPVLPPIPAGRYADPEFARLEDEAVFGRSWLFVAHVGQLRDAGDYLLLDHLPKPVMLVRGHDDEIRAFYNTCKHRGAALLADPVGNTGRRLTCPYHNWVYSLQGDLIGYPEANNFCDLDREMHALTAIRCETWGPLVFVNLDPAAVPLHQFLANVADDLSEIAHLEKTMHLVDRTVRNVPVNWKIPVDANIETYHVNYVHRNSAAKGLRQAATGIQLLANGHSRMLIRLHDGLVFPATFPALMEGVGDLPQLGTFSYHVFPNLSIVFGGPGFIFFITNWPSGPSTSEYHVHWCSSLDPDDDANRALLDGFVEMNSNVLFEDLTVLPGIQASIDAGALEFLRLNYQERRIYYVHETIDRAIGVEQVPEGLRVPQILGTFVED